MPLTYVEDERPFLLERDRHLVLTWGEPLEAGLEETAERFLERTLDYWRRWVKGTRVPRDYQQEVVRSALALKLHQYEDTGALLAATTTSLPEHPGSGRNWDYRFCWLRDAYFTLNAFERLGHSEEMERFLEYLRNLAEENEGVLQPAYRINGDSDAEERVLEHLSGFNGDGPVRIGNQAFEHVQNDVYGEMVLGVSRLFLDARFVGEVPRHTAVDIIQGARRPDGRAARGARRGALGVPREDAAAQLLRAHALGGSAARGRGRRRARGARARRPRPLGRGARPRRARDAVLERGGRRAHAGRRRAAGRRGDAPRRPPRLLRAATTPAPTGTSTRSAARCPWTAASCAATRCKDDFGHMEAAFTVCTFWLVEALALIGRTDEARELFDRLLSLDNGLGLYSEDILPETLEQSGNFPQTYSHVGLINAAFRLSRRWD